MSLFHSSAVAASGRTFTSLLACVVARLALACGYVVLVPLVAEHTVSAGGVMGDGYARVSLEVTYHYDTRQTTDALSAASHGITDWSLITSRGGYIGNRI